MEKILIQNYRGFDIEFDVDSEKFHCLITEDNAKESSSFSAVKKFIDDYKKENQDFKPFYVIAIPTGYSMVSENRLKIIGKRKDNRLVAENEKGNKIQISDYNLKDYMIEKEENEVHLAELKRLEAGFRVQRSVFEESSKEVRGKLKIVSLKDFMETLK